MANETRTLRLCKNQSSADDKRSRLSYDSYELVMKRQSLPSLSWDMDKYMTADSDFLGIIAHASNFP